MKWHRQQLTQPVRIGDAGDHRLARWYGVAVLGLSAIDQMFFIPAYPFWSLVHLS
jgi:hypothetical protein